MELETTEDKQINRTWLIKALIPFYEVDRCDSTVTNCLQARVHDQTRTEFFHLGNYQPSNEIPPPKYRIQHVNCLQNIQVIQPTLQTIQMAICGIDLIGLTFITRLDRSTVRLVRITPYYIIFCTHILLILLLIIAQFGKAKYTSQCHYMKTSQLAPSVRLLSVIQFPTSFIAAAADFLLGFMKITQQEKALKRSMERVSSHHQ